MTEVEILNKIILHNGNCSGWANAGTCAKCPLSKLRTRSDGTYLSCLESIGAQALPEAEADAKYLEVAKRILISEEIDSLLAEGSDGS